jgi:hypothetical protein
MLLGAHLFAAPAQDLAQARGAYQFGDYKKVIQLLVPALYPMVSFESTVDQIQARRLLSLAFLFERNVQAAEREFVALLALDPGFTLDPLIDPPQFVDFFNVVRAKHKEQLAAEERRRREEDEMRRWAEAKRADEEHRAEARRQEALRYVWVTDERSRWLTVVPFGVGQFQNGQRKKGFALLGAEAALGGASLSLALTVRLRYRDGTFPYQDAEERDRADALVSAQVITGALFFAAAIYGALDGLYYYDSVPLRPRKVLRESIGLGPAGLQGWF